jgi:hypothetical protein
VCLSALARRRTWPVVSEGRFTRAGQDDVACVFAHCGNYESSQVADATSERLVSLMSSRKGPVIAGAVIVVSVIAVILALVLSGRGESSVSGADAVTSSSAQEVNPDGSTPDPSGGADGTQPGDTTEGDGSGSASTVPNGEGTGSPDGEATEPSDTVVDPEAVVKVPEVMGLSVVQAVAELRKAGLVPFNLVLLKQSGSPGTVLVSAPDEGMEVKAGSPVTLYMQEPAEGKIPNLANLPVREATEKLLSEGFALGWMEAAPDSAYDPAVTGEGLVLATGPGKGSRATVVSLSFSGGLSELPMPNLVGMDVSLAHLIIAAWGYVPNTPKVSAQYLEVTSSNYDETLPLGSEIVLEFEPRDADFLKVK